MEEEVVSEVEEDVITTQNKPFKFVANMAIELQLVIVNSIKL